MTGHRVWVIPEGYIPTGSFSDRPDLVSHEAACILNCGDVEASIEITLYFEDREPAGPYHVKVGARRTLHMRFNGFETPAPAPRDIPFASVFRSSAPIVVQQTRLNSRDPHIALMTTMAFPVVNA